MSAVKQETVSDALKRLIPRRRPRKGQMNEDHRQRCVDYYTGTHSIQDLAGMLVDLEWQDGYEPAVE